MNKKAAMEEAIVVAWATDDPEVKEFQARLFPNGKPTVEEYIAVIIEYVEKQLSAPQS